MFIPSSSRKPPTVTKDVYNVEKDTVLILDLLSLRHRNNNFNTIDNLNAQGNLMSTERCLHFLSDDTRQYTASFEIDKTDTFDPDYLPHIKDSEKQNMVTSDKASYDEEQKIEYVEIIALKSSITNDLQCCPSTVLRLEELHDKTTGLIVWRGWTTI